MEKKVTNGIVKMEDGWIYFIDSDTTKKQCFMCDNINVFNSIHDELSFGFQQDQFNLIMDKKSEMSKQEFLAGKIASQEYEKQKTSLFQKALNKIVFGHE